MHCTHRSQARVHFASTWRVSSSKTYGESRIPLISKLIGMLPFAILFSFTNLMIALDECKFDIAGKTFVDLGSGVGQVGRELSTTTLAITPPHRFAWWLLPWQKHRGLLLALQWCRLHFCQPTDAGALELKYRTIQLAILWICCQGQKVCLIYATIVAFLQTYGSAQLLHQIPGMCRKRTCWACSNRAASWRLLDKCSRQRGNFLRWPRIHEQPSIRGDFESQSVTWVPFSPFSLQERVSVFDG